MNRFLIVNLLIVLIETPVHSFTDLIWTRLSRFKKET